MRRWPLAAALVLVTGCSAILGFEDGEPLVDGADGADAGELGADAPTGADATFDAAADVSDASDASDASGDAPIDAPSDATLDAPADAVVGGGTKQAFETSAVFNGRLDAPGVPGAGGVAAGDQRCMDAAQASFPGRTFVAWLSTAAVSAESRLAGGGPWYVGAALLGDLGDLKTGSLRTALDRDPEGGQISAAPIGVWTGTDVDGKPAPLHCSDWSTPASNVGGEVGTTGGAGGNWTYAVTRTCNFLFHLYCFEK